MARKINALGLEKLKSWEGYRLDAYQDSAGVWSIGYGHTAAAGEPTPFKGLRITPPMAEKILMRDLEKFEKRVERLVTVPLTDNQFAALVSFDFNTGALHKSTLLKKLNKGDYNAVPVELMKWVKSGGKKLDGLVNRRAAEAGLWATGEFVTSAHVPVTAASSPVVTKETITWGAGIAATLGALFEGSGPVQWALGAVIGVSFAIGLFFFIKKRMRPG